MKLKDIGEFGLIEKISRGCLIRPENIIKAIGDDAAVFLTEPGTATLVTTDLLVERVHFLRNVASGFSLGHKSLAVNLSDIAAMGGTAKEVFVSIAIPNDCPIKYIEDLYDGIKTLAARYEVNVLGGDTTGSKTDLIINIAVTGSVLKEEVLLRSSAKPGDMIACTGFPGESRAGLHLILEDLPTDSEPQKHLFNAHVMPEPHLHEGRFLSKSPGIHACIDVSDGLSSDIRHILKESGVGAKLYTQQIPISSELQHFCRKFDFQPVEYALSGGEDYFLLCTMSKQEAEKIAEDFMKEFNRSLHIVGEISDSGNLTLTEPNGEEKVIISTGWDHFEKG
ncbi:MAG: thiamine-phosphate kinase [Desulfobacterales bacterium]|nr:thiamine-phosphate kinase [Desulfobacterales bacterium]